jgi:iron complex transport system substrate-binding protein
VRICSLVPAATEVLFALGLGDSVVGVTHECDYPPEATSREVLTASLLDADELSSAEVDRAVAAAAADGTPLYAVEEERWDELVPDVVVVQGVCDVCAVSADDASSLVSARKVKAEIVDYSPTTLEGIAQAIASLGAELGADAAADEVVSGMQSRLERVQGALEGVDSAPRVFVAEWLDPPYAAGHWVPDMVAAAAGIDVAGTSGELSHRMRWSDIIELRPDVVVLAPCGFDLDRTLDEIAPFELSAHLLGTPAREESRVFAVDAGAFFSRPSPRVVDGVELLAFLFHPGAYADPGVPWSRIRL